MAYDVERLLRLWSEPSEDDEQAAAAFRTVYADPVVVNGTELRATDLVQRARSLLGALDDVERELLDQVEADGKVAIAFRLSGRHVGPLSTGLGPVPPTGERVVLRIIDILTLVDGRITEIAMVADELGALSALGVVGLTPGPGGAVPSSRGVTL